MTTQPLYSDVIGNASFVVVHCQHTIQPSTNTDGLIVLYIKKGTARLSVTLPVLGRKIYKHAHSRVERRTKSKATFLQTVQIPEDA